MSVTSFTVKVRPKKKRGDSFERPRLGEIVEEKRAQLAGGAFKAATIAAVSLMTRWMIMGAVPS